MNTLKILHNHCNLTSKKKTVFFIENEYYSEIIEFSLRRFLKKILFLIFKKTLFYLGGVKNRTRFKFIRIDKDILSIRGNLIEKSLVIIKADAVVKIYEDISEFSRGFYSDYYSVFHQEKSVFFSIPSLFSLTEKENLFTIFFEKIIFSDKMKPLRKVKEISDSFEIALSKLDLPNLNEEKELNKKSETVRLIDKLISEKLSQIDDLVFCHGDLWRGNLLFGEMNKAYIIDFDNLTKQPKDFDFIYYLLNEVLAENKNFLLKVLKEEKIKYSKIQEYLDLIDELKNCNANEFLFFAYKFRYNLLNNDNYISYQNEIIHLLSRMSSGYSILNNIDKYE